MTKADILRIAAGEIGTEESPKNSNKTKYGKWARYDGVPWCGLFTSWCYEKAGFPLPRIGFRFNGFAGCQTAVAYFRKHNKIVQDPQPGDIVFYDWNKDGRHDHVGIFEGWIDNNTFTAIEGNTAVGNDSNGGKVMRRNRNKSVALFVRMV
jgi:hypothetical protein